ncbi:hypothetical protein FH972_024561 [Carpinus fangiana]|uniref:Peptidase M16 N-terminal domain-containing protein n=1 Tax=Carpinus fangiana TaxID=176857 RepID=A0A5N6KZ98_9ROSI|nr:hypothetical protein FH972_024561 [Carpinus fangiana]
MASPGQPPKTMSSRLMGMKFMQRGAASPTTSNASDSPSTKRAKLNNGSPQATRAADQEAIQAVQAQEDAKREAVLEKLAEEAGDTKWVLQTHASAKPSLRVFNAGYGAIDRRAITNEATGNEDSEDDDEEQHDNKSQVAGQAFGRKSYGKFNKKIEKQQNPDLSSSSSEDDELDSDEDESASSEASAEHEGGSTSHLIKARPPPLRSAASTAAASKSTLRTAYRASGVSSVFARVRPARPQRAPSASTLANMELTNNSRTWELVTDKLETPSLDNRSYKVIRLLNKLEALIIHDPDTDKASAALDVNVGALSDDRSMPGMAHAVEHLLFMGTEKYPKENDYSQYLAANSGYSNASTGSTSTNYYFEVAAKAEEGALDDQGPLHGALDRFAQFFVAPLFLADTLDRELRAVESENKKNLQSDAWRLQQLHRSLGNPAHPFSGFSTGNLETLRDAPQARGVKIRDAFIDFYQKHYSANRMKLVVLGREPLDQLTTWVESMFAGVPNKDLPQNRWDGLMPYAKNQLQKLVFAKPVMSNHSLEIRFVYPDETDLYEVQPARYLSHLIGHEGPGSILAYIKAKGWAVGLSAGYRSVCPGAALFTSNISLTPKGLAAYTEVVKAFFQYISILKETKAQQWIYEEMKDIAAVNFRFQQKAPASRTTSSLSGAMQEHTPREWLLSGPELLRRYDAELINSAIASLTPDNVRITVVSQDAIPKEDEILREKWYGTEYSIKSIPNDFLEELKQASTSTKGRPSELYLPGKNEFIPSRLDVEKKDTTEPAQSPKLIRNDANTRLWFKKDDQFWVPQASLQIILRNPICNLSPRATVMAACYVQLVHDALGEYTYDAELAGLNYGLVAYSAGFNITIDGYNDKMHVLLEKVLTTMRDLEFSEDRWEIVKDRMIRSYQNSEYTSPYQQIGIFTRWLGEEKGFLREQLLAELPALEAADIRAFRPLLLGQLHTEILAHGNLYREDALKLTDIVDKILHPRTLPAIEHPIRRSLVLPDGATYHYNRTLKDPSNVNHCIQYVLQVGDIRDRARLARLRLFAQMNEEAAFNQLRTVEQLGYVVFSGSMAQITMAAYHVLIQSERSPDFLEGRIELFLRGFRDRLAAMSQEDFEGYKRSVINARLEKVKNLTQETNRFWAHVSNEMYFFDDREDDVLQLKPLTKDDMLKFYEEFINPDGATRSKIAVRMHAQATAPQKATLGAEEVRSKIVGTISQYLSSQGIHVDDAKLAAALANVDVTNGDQATILEATTKYIKENAGSFADKASTIVEQGKAVMEQAFAALTKQGPNAEAIEDVVPANERKPTVIEDVHAYKAALLTTAGAQPIRPLSEYEDLESKL